ncbi:MAG TPA: flagellar hook capping FlgD N-terminal domain-containing protein [Terracidiphilus sp.]|nr:flagellar hook capping FlgD N-terminal domain-containing protein [Terracidiphilus sp.]
MAALAGILQHMPTAQALPGATAMDSSSGDSDTSASGNSATISANDFLTLLVTEMQNQDPTADTDPNEYINQLVNVNSLEQLIDINQTLSTAMGSTSATGGVAQAGTVAQAEGAEVAPSIANGSVPAAAAKPYVVDGNLGTPTFSPAAQRVAQSLGGVQH